MMVKSGGLGFENLEYGVGVCGFGERPAVGARAGETGLLDMKDTHRLYRGTSPIRKTHRKYQPRSVRPPYRGTSLIRNSPLVGPYSRTMPRAPWWP